MPESQGWVRPHRWKSFDLRPLPVLFRSPSSPDPGTRCCPTTMVEGTMVALYGFSRIQEADPCVVLCSGLSSC